MKTKNKVDTLAIGWVLTVMVFVLIAFVVAAHAQTAIFF